MALRTPVVAAITVALAAVSALVAGPASADPAVQGTYNPTL